MNWIDNQSISTYVYLIYLDFIIIIFCLTIYPQIWSTGPENHKSLRWKSTEIPLEFHRKSGGFMIFQPSFLKNGREEKLGENKLRIKLNYP